MRRTHLILAAALAAAAPLAAQQHPQTREGFWIGFGLGAGSAGASCDVCSGDREVGLSGHLRAGATVSPQLLLGAETNGWYKSEGGLTQQIGAFSATLTAYPAVADGFYLKGGLGLLVYRADDNIDELTSTGLGLSAGLGYDVRVGDNFSLVPYGNVLLATGGDLKFDGADLNTDFNANLVQFGLGVMWH